MPDQSLLRISLLGAFGVAVGVHPIDAAVWNQRRAASVVKLLALEPGHRLHRDQVLDTLWPDFSLDAAANNLRFALHTARRALESAGAPRNTYLTREGEQIVLGPAGQIWVDVDAFERAMHDAWQTTDPAVYTGALEAYAGELLPDDLYEDWVTSRRTALTSSYLALLSRQAELYEQRGAFGDAIATLQHRLIQEPACEEAHAGLMRLYAQSGQVRQALSQYDRLRIMLVKELGVAPEKTTQDLYQAIRDGQFPQIFQLPEPAATGRGAEPTDAPLTNLPATVSDVIGRERELAELTLLMSAHRLLTLIGPGGIGKTRLALAVAHDQHPRFADGALFVSLGPIRDPALIVPAIAQQAGVQEIRGQPLQESLHSFLRDKHLLLVLDNFEQVVHAASVITDLLENVPRLQVLVTSRMRLRLRGEQLYPVQPLALPDFRLPSVEGNLVQYAAINLFIQRAREVRPGFAITDAVASTIAEICRRLDGLPLAIELAAANSTVLTPLMMLARLEHKLSFLTGEARDVPERQQTIRNTIQWSYDLLSPTEQVLFSNLSVFNGGWTLAAAETVVGHAGIGVVDVLGGLSSLVDASLVTQSEDAEGELRFSMLETIREYALEQLATHGEAAEAHERHAAFFLTITEHAEPHLHGPQQRAWMDHLERERDNLRASLRWAIAHDPELAAHFSWLLVRLWRVRALAEGRHWADQIVIACEKASPTARGKSRFTASALAFTQGDLAAVDSLLQECVPLLEQLDDPRVLAAILCQLGGLVAGVSDIVQSEAYFTRAIDLYREQDNLHGVSMAANNLGLIYHTMGMYDRAIPLLEQSIEIDRIAGDAHGVAEGQVNLAFSMLALENITSAATLLQQALPVLYEMGNFPGMAECLEGLAGIAATGGKSQRATSLLGAAQRLREQTGAAHESNRVSDFERIVASTRSQLDASVWSSAWNTGLTMPLDAVMADAL